MAEPTPLSLVDNETDGARKLPSNLEAEAAFLGAVLIDNRVIEELQTPIRPDHFLKTNTTGSIWKASSIRSLVKDLNNSIRPDQFLTSAPQEAFAKPLRSDPGARI